MKKCRDNDENMHNCKILFTAPLRKKKTEVTTNAEKTRIQKLQQDKFIGSHEISFVTQHILLRSELLKPTESSRYKKEKQKMHFSFFTHANLQTIKR